MFYCYPCLLSFYPPPPAIPARRKRGKEGARGEIEGRRGPRRREEGPAFQSPVSTRDPRPLNHPPQLGRNSVLFSPLFSSFLPFFLPLRSPPPSALLLFFFIYLSPFFDLSYQTTETTAGPFLLLRLVVVFFFLYFCVLGEI